MSTVTTIEVVDLLTIRECIEILVDRRTGRDRTPTLPPAVVDYLGATHVRPRAWTDEAKDLLRQALVAGEIGLYASRKIRDGTNAVSDAFVRIPSENLDRSIAFHIALPSDVLRGAGPRLPRTFQRQRDTYQKVGVAGLVGTASQAS